MTSEFIQILSVLSFNNFIHGILQRRLGLFDFSFYAWPVDYHWDESKAEYVLLQKLTCMLATTLNRTGCEKFKKKCIVICTVIYKFYIIYFSVMLNKIQNIIE